MTSIDSLALAVLLGGVVLLVYTYLLYPASLWLLGKLTQAEPIALREPEEWPCVSITVPVFNEEAQIADLLENLLALDYPSHRLQILIVSDSSSDGTDEIVRRFAPRGIELLRVEPRGGKSRAENEALPRLRGEIIVNTDASIRFPSESLKRLVTAFGDPSVGLASGRDISVSSEFQPGRGSNLGESGYVGYEMLIRDLETRVSGIVGASGCYYAIRKALHQWFVPESLSRDFAAALHTIEAGYRAVSVPDAICWVPRNASIRREYRRKVRTITRGMGTLHFKRTLLNPKRFAKPSWMLFSHKICRWALPWAGLLALGGLGVLAHSHQWAVVLLVFCALLLLLAWIGWVLDGKRSIPRVLSLPAFLVVGNLAASHALVRFLRGAQHPVWEPTRRGR